eukprot:g7184.t1
MEEKVYSKKPILAPIESDGFVRDFDVVTDSAQDIQAFFDKYGFSFGIASDLVTWELWALGLIYSRCDNSKIDKILEFIKPSQKFLKQKIYGWIMIA